MLEKIIHEHVAEDLKVNMLEKIIREHVAEDLKVKAIKALFEQQTISPLDLETKAFFTGQTALHLAVSLGLEEVAKVLVDLGGDVNDVDAGYQSPLHYAAESGLHKLIIYFGYHGALLNLKDEVGNTPLHLAVQSKHPECVLALHMASNFTLDTTLVNLQNKTPWFLLNFIEDLKIKQALAEALSKRADYFGRSAFHVAVIHGDLEMVKLHANSGVQINEQDKEGNTAVHLAVQCGHRAIVYWLCNEYVGHINSDEINFDIKNHRGYTPLHICAEKKDAACIKFLVSGKKPARKDIQNSQGLLPEDLIKKWSIDNEEIKILVNALASSYVIFTEDYEKKLFPPEPERPAGYLGYFRSDKRLKILAKSLASPQFESQFSRGRLADASHNPSKPATPAQHRKSIRPTISLSREDMLHPSEVDFSDQVLVHPKETEGESFLEKAFETHDLSQVLYLVKNVKTPNDCQFILEEFKKYCKKFHTENTNIFLEVLAENLASVSTSSEEDFVAKCNRIQTSFHKKLCADGLREIFAIHEINTLTQKNLDTISTDEETQKKLLALIKWCSGVPKNAKNSNDHIFDSNKLRINFLGLTDFNEIEELIFLLSKLNSYFSHIQKLLSHYIVFTIIKKCDDYGYDLDKGSVPKSINFYLDNCCDNATKTILLEYKDLLHSYKTSSPHSLIKQINFLIANTVFTQKESIINHIAKYMSKSPAELKNTELEYKKVEAICRAFTEISTKFCQSFDIHKWRGKCFAVDNPEVAPELLAHNGMMDLMSFFIKKVILSYSSQQKQAQAMNLFLLVAREAFHNRPHPQIVAPDFTTAAAVYLANISLEISNLKLTPLLDKPAKKIEKALSILVNPRGRFKEFHMLQAADHRILPFTAAIFKKKDFMYEFELYNATEDLGEMFDTLMFVKNRLAKVVFLDNSSDLEDQLQQLKNQMLENDVPVRKPSSERQRLSLAPSKEMVPSSRKLAAIEGNAPRKKSTPERKVQKITSLEDNTPANVEHSDEEVTLRRTSAPRKTSSGQGTCPRKELQDYPSLKNLAAETQRFSERKVPKLLRRLSGENRHSTIIHSEKHTTSPLSPRERSSSSEEKPPLQNDHPEQEGQPPSTKHLSFKGKFRTKFTFSAEEKSSTDKSSTDKSSASSPRNFPNRSNLFQSSSSSSSDEVKPAADATLKKEFS